MSDTAKSTFPEPVIRAALDAWWQANKRDGKSTYVAMSRALDAAVQAATEYLAEERRS